MYHVLLLVMEFLTLGTSPDDLVSVVSPGALVIVAVAAAAALALHLVRGPVRPAAEAAADAVRAMRRRSQRLPVVTSRAPDAAGKPRPRAPGAALAAAR